MEEIHRIQHAQGAFKVLNYFDIAHDISRTDVERAYRRIAFLLHPDKTDLPGADAAMTRAVNARDTLLALIPEF